MAEMLDQFRGCLLGLACGDALGAPLEFMSAEKIAAKHGRVTEMLGGGWLNLGRGGVTDDTQMMLQVLESYVERHGFDPHDIAERFLAWYRTGPVDIGNGSLMRCAPTGLYRYHDNIHLIGESRVISGITHYDERCKLACVCLNLAIAHLLMVGVEGLLEELLDFIEPRNTVIGYALRAIPGLRPGELRTTGFVLDTLQAALWTVIYVETFEEGLVLTVNRGGDADTASAVSGALLGTRFGADAIPQRWLEVLECRDRIDRAAIRLHELTMEG